MLHNKHYYRSVAIYCGGGGVVIMRTRSERIFLFILNSIYCKVTATVCYYDLQNNRLFNQFLVLFL